MRILATSIALSSLLFATDVSNYNEKEPSQSEQLQIMKEKQKKIREKLQRIPGLQQKIIEFQKVIERASKGQRKLVTLYFKAKKICDTQRAKNELRGYSHSRIESNYENCLEEINGENSVFRMHTKFLKDINSFKERVKEDIKKSEDLLDENESLTVKGEYVDEAIQILEDMIKTGEN
jgi:hypothetical protein